MPTWAPSGGLLGLQAPIWGLQGSWGLARPCSCLSLAVPRRPVSRAAGPPYLLACSRPWLQPAARRAQKPGRQRRLHAVTSLLLGEAGDREGHARTRLPKSEPVPRLQPPASRSRADRDFRQVGKLHFPEHLAACACASRTCKSQAQH